MEQQFPFRLGLVLAVVVGLAWAGKPMARPATEFTYFNHVFMSMVNPDRPAEEAASFQSGYASIFGLNEAEVAQLRANAEEFRGALIQMRAASAATYAVARSLKRGELGQSEQESLGGLADTFNARVVELGEQFLAAVTPEAAGRIRAAFGGSGTGPAIYIGESGNEGPSPLLLPGRPQPHAVLSFAAWKACLLATGTGSTCTLMQGTYNVTSTIPVERSNITVSGDPSGVAKLVRASPWPLNMVQVGDASHTGITNVTFSNLTFEGNSQNIPGSVCPSGCYNSTYVDLNLGIYATWNTYVSNCTFDDSPTFSIFTVYYSYVDSSTFNFNTNSAYAGFAAFFAWNAAGTTQSIGLQFTNSTVSHSGLNAVYLAGVTDALIQYDHFYGNHQTCFGGASGGQIAVTNNAPQGMKGSDVSVLNNYADGQHTVCPPPNPYVSNGLEMYGTDYTVENNTFINHKGAGMTVSNSSGTTVSSNTIENNAFDGIALFGNLDGSGCAPTPTGGVMYTISSNTVTGNGMWGLESTAQGCANGPFQTPEANSPPTTWNVTLTPVNTFTGNGTNAPDFH